MERTAPKLDKDSQDTIIRTIQRQRRKTHNSKKRRTIEERWWLGSQLATAAPRDSSKLRWIPRENALAMWTCKHQEPRTAPVEVV